MMNEQKKNIAYVSNYPHFKMGGQKSMLALIRELDRNIFNPHCFVPEKGELSEELERLKCKVHFIKVPPLKPKNYPKLPSLLKNIREKLNNEKIDIVHPDSERDALLFGLACTFSKTRLIWHVRLTRKDPQDAIIYRLSDGVIGISDGVANRFESFKNFKSKFRKIFNGADLNKFYPLDNKSNKQKKLGIDSSKRNILFAGQLKDGKGILDLLKASKLVDSSTHFYFAGKQLKDKDYDKYQLFVNQQELKEKVSFLGHVNNVNEWMQACDILVLPSHEGVEGMGRVIFEAMACGCVPIGSNTSGVKEAIFEGSGLLFEAHDHIDLSEKINSLVTDKKLLDAMSLKSIELARKHFDIKNHAKNVMKFYEDILN